MIRRGSLFATIGAAVVWLFASPTAASEFKYDALGRLVCVQYGNSGTGGVTRYYYDAAGNRVAVTSVATGDDCDNTAPTPPTPTAPANATPDAVNDSIGVVKNTARTFDPRVNDSDADGNPITITAKTNPSHGSVTFTTTSITYTPTTGYTGSDSFTYTISDNHAATDTATVNVTVALNASPTAVNDSLDATAPVGSPANGQVNVLGNDSDPDAGQLLTIISATNGTKGTTGFAGGLISYTANDASKIGSDSFTYTISDGAGGTATATVTVHLTHEN